MEYVEKGGILASYLGLRLFSAVPPSSLSLLRLLEWEGSPGDSREEDGHGGENFVGQEKESAVEGKIMADEGEREEKVREEVGEKGNIIKKERIWKKKREREGQGVSSC